MSIRVDAADINALGHVNNIVYLRWVQDVAKAHWFSAAPKDEQDGLVWMVVRHEIDYSSPAVLNDEIILHTWIGAAAGLRSTATRRSCEQATARCWLRREQSGCRSTRRAAGRNACRSGCGRCFRWNRPMVAGV